MALFQCPECGQMISDQAMRCPKCGYPVKEKSLPKTEPFIVPDGPANAGNNSDEKKLKRKMTAIGVAAVGILAVFIVLVVLKIAGGKLNVENLEIKRWKVTNESTYVNYYEGTVVSDEKAPFIAVIGSSEHQYRSPSLVYMEEGQGIMETYEAEDEDPSVKYVPLGYMVGKTVKVSDIRSMSCEDTAYEDWGDDTSCQIDVEVELKHKKSGILFVEIQNDLTDEILHNIAINIVKGEGNYSDHLVDLPLKSRGVEVTVVPKYFCDAKVLKKNDFTVEEEMTYEKFESDSFVSFSGTEELAFDGYEDGLVLYTDTLTKGGEKEERGKEERKCTPLYDESCIIRTYDFNEEEAIIEPQHEIDVIGYLAWSALK